MPSGVPQPLITVVCRSCKITGFDLENLPALPLSGSDLPEVSASRYFVVLQPQTTDLGSAPPAVTLTPHSLVEKDQTDSGSGLGGEGAQSAPLAAGEARGVRARAHQGKSPGPWGSERYYVWNTLLTICPVCHR